MFKLVYVWFFFYLICIRDEETQRFDGIMNVLIILMLNDNLFWHIGNTLKIYIFY
jgi:hypothetical protein